MFYASQPSEKTNLTQGHQTPGQYQQYRAIGRYIRFYVIYVKSANKRIQG
jgi:hypothetical protein